jgi:trigger factor
MRATTAPGEGNLVHLTVEIDEPEVNRALDGVVKTLAKQITVPGFRPGKVPRQILEARMGGAANLRAEGLREVLPDFYAQALIDEALDPIAPPDIEITGGEDQGAVSFVAIVQVRPIVAIPGYAGLQVTVPGLQPTDEEIDAQINRLRENEGELVDVDRSVADGDHVTVDIRGTGNGGEEVVSVEDYV